MGDKIDVSLKQKWQIDLFWGTFRETSETRETKETKAKDRKGYVLMSPSGTKEHEGR